MNDMGASSLKSLLASNNTYNWYLHIQLHVFLSVLLIVGCTSIFGIALKIFLLRIKDSVTLFHIKGLLYDDNHHKPEKNIAFEHSMQKQPTFELDSGFIFFFIVLNSHLSTHLKTSR